MKLRHELKHLITPGEDLLLTGNLSKLFPHDKHADSHGSYRVSSLYFDTPSDQALREKLDGVNNREKFRIRYYDDDLSFLRLEKKVKVNGLGCKFSAPLTKEQVECILQGDIAFLMESGEPLLQELYHKMQGKLLRPRTIVTYDREAFLYTPGNVRITLDRSLRTATNPEHFLHPLAFHLPMHDGMHVLEVKWDNFLPEVVQLAVQLPQCRTSAYSKYAVCRRYD